MVIIVLCVVGGLAWLEIIPVRAWVKKAQIAYQGKKARFIIELIDKFRDFL
ncbi:hypothetical protein JNO48_10565 [Clostridiales bacterium]|nr:hypothetical protein JNO48_10565 [Clostridiales bacterium]